MTTMHVNRAKFFPLVRPILGGKLTQGQVDGLNKILDYAEKRKFYVWDELAAMLGQSYLESGHTFQPIREYGGEAYLRGKKYYPWVGEGLIQVTWEANHKKFGATAPGQLLTWEKALPALFDGMLKGMFTGRKLDDYFHGPESARVQDWRGQRAIVNPKDYKTYDTIADLSRKFYSAIMQSLEPGERAVPVPPIAVDHGEPAVPPVETADKDLEDCNNPPPIAPQPAPQPSLWAKIFGHFDLHMFRKET